MSVEKQLIDDIKRTLIARIIPGLPLTPKTNDGYDRDRVREIINGFEFEWYLKKVEKRRPGE